LTATVNQPSPADFEFGPEVWVCKNMETRLGCSLLQSVILHLQRYASFLNKFFTRFRNIIRSLKYALNIFS
jgi:hypothetical protein